MGRPLSARKLQSQLHNARKQQAGGENASCSLATAQKHSFIIKPLPLCTEKSHPCWISTWQTAMEQIHSSLSGGAAGRTVAWLVLVPKCPSPRPGLCPPWESKTVSASHRKAPAPLNVSIFKPTWQLSFLQRSPAGRNSAGGPFPRDGAGSGKACLLSFLLRSHTGRHRSNTGVRSWQPSMQPPSSRNSQPEKDVPARSLPWMAVDAFWHGRTWWQPPHHPEGGPDCQASYDKREEKPVRHVSVSSKGVSASRSRGTWPGFRIPASLAGPRPRALGWRRDGAQVRQEARRWGHGPPRCGDVSDRGLAEGTWGGWDWLGGVRPQKHAGALGHRGGWS